MERLTLKNSDLSVSRLCFGGCPMGGHGWGKVSENELIQTVNQALEVGVNFFDTADTYGLGQSEITLGKALGSKRHNAVIGTKFGVRVINGKTFYDNSDKWIRIACEKSLLRLGTDYIDLYQIHYCDNVTPMDEVIGSLEGLQRRGLIRYFGLSNIYIKDFSEMNQYIGKFISFQDEYSLACRKNENDIKELSEKLELTPLTWGSLGQGILSGKYDENATFSTDDRRSKDIYVNFHGDKLKKNLEIVSMLKRISCETGYPVSAIAVRWILDYIEESIVITGIKDRDQLSKNTMSLGWKMQSEHIRLLHSVSIDKDNSYM